MNWRGWFEGSFLKLKIPLPTLSEQKAIVAKLDRAQRLIDIDREMLAKYDELIQSVFLEMFGDPVRNTMGIAKRHEMDFHK
jgi:type I restriction enzyme, S subunit